VLVSTGSGDGCVVASRCEWRARKQFCRVLGGAGRPLGATKKSRWELL